VIAAGETYSAFSKRALEKLHALFDVNISRLHIVVTDSEGIPKKIPEFELMSKLASDLSLQFHVRKRSVSPFLDWALEKLRDRTLQKYNFSGHRVETVPDGFEKLVDVAISIDLSSNRLTSLPVYFGDFSALKVRQFI